MAVMKMRNFPAVAKRSSGKSVMIRAALIGGVALALAGCGAKPTPQGINDPNEQSNRAAHEFNRGLDRALVRPASSAYDTLLPAPVEQGIANVADNLNEPSNLLNSLLQGRMDNAGLATLRFAMNTTFGLGGLFDVASALGMKERDTDFGETLHVWGASEGNYVEFPFVGPTTERDLAGIVVDLATNPLRYALPTREANVATAFKLGSKLGDRAKYSDTVDSILYESADSYAQARLLYLQNRRYSLGSATGEAAEDSFLDPYEDPYVD